MISKSPFRGGPKIYLLMELVDRRERGQISVISKSPFRGSENKYLLMELVDRSEKGQISVVSKSPFRGSENISFNEIGRSEGEGAYRRFPNLPVGGP